MVDPITQLALYPLHDRLFSILRGCKQDATFDQGEGVQRLRDLLKRKVDKGKIPYAFSFDLSSATDRLPVELQALLLEH